MASKGQETYAMMRFHLNIGQTSAVNHTPERGGDIIVLPQSLWDYKGNTTEAQASPPDPWLVPGFEVALGWLWGAYQLAINRLWGGFNVALKWLWGGFEVGRIERKAVERIPEPNFRNEMKKGRRLSVPQ